MGWKTWETEATKWERKVTFLGVKVGTEKTFVDWVETWLLSTSVCQSSIWTEDEMRENVNFARHNVSKDFFANRVVKYWNYLPQDVDFLFVQP